MKTCDYCGQNLTAELAACPSCGNELAPTTEASYYKKSKGSAVILALIFGPLGLLYLGVEGMMVILFIIGVSIFLLPVILLSLRSSGLHINGFNLLIALLARAGSIWWALNVIDRRNNELKSEPDANVLLDEATKLEGVDFGQAIAKYEEVIEKHPNSSASKVAQSCVLTLKANK